MPWLYDYLIWNSKKIKEDDGIFEHASQTIGKNT